LLAGICFGLVLAILGNVRGTTSYDDPFITYTYAASFARGEGLTWNGEAVLGTSTPFLALLLGTLERAIPLGVPVWGAVVYWFSVGVASIALLLLGARERWAAAAAFAAAALPLQLFVHLHVGSEMLPAIASVAVAALLLARERWWAAGVALALAVAFRAEAGTAAVALAFAHGIARRRSGSAIASPIARVAGGSLAAITIWLVALFLLTGAIIPSTLAAKRAQAESALRLWRSGLEVIPEAIRDLPFELFLLRGAAAGWIAAAAFALGTAGLLRSRGVNSPGRLALLLWGPLQLAGVAALGVAYYPWYAVPFFFSAALLVAQAAELLPNDVTRFWRLPGARAAVGGIAGTLTVLFLSSAPPPWQLYRGGGDLRRPAYESVADVVSRFPPGTSVAAFEVGYLGHRSRRPVLDLLGLVTPGADLAHVRSGRLRENLDRLDPDLLMLSLNSGSLFHSVVGDPVSFDDRYDLERLQLEPGTPLVVYRRSSLRGGVVDLLPELRKAGAAPIVRGPGFSIVAARLAGGARTEIFVQESVPASRFFAGAITDPPEGAHLVLRLTRGDRRERRIATLSLVTDEWARWERDLPPLAAGDRLVIECQGPRTAVCDLGAPHLAPLAATAAPAR
jgi:hypothetical protein